MKIPKPTEDDKEYFKSVVPDDPRVEVKPMFGNLAAFVNGNMFMGLFGPDIGIRLSDAQRDELAGIDGAGPFGPEERPMKEYVSIPAQWRDNGDVADSWIAKALEHTAQMPPKKKTKAKKMNI